MSLFLIQVILNLLNVGFCIAIIVVNKRSQKLIRERAELDKPEREKTHRRIDLINELYEENERLRAKLPVIQVKAYRRLLGGRAWSISTDYYTDAQAKDLIAENCRYGEPIDVPERQI